MIRQTINHGTIVWHEVLGFGIFRGYESKIGTFNGFALVNFDNHKGLSVIHPKKLTEIEKG